MKKRGTTLLSGISMLIVVTVVMSAAYPRAFADEVSITGGITVFNEGGLEVILSQPEISFQTDEGGNAKVSSIQGDTVYAVIPLKIEDDRADGARDPYVISLRLLTPTNAPYFIDASNAVFTDVSELPDGLTQSFTDPVGADSAANVVNSAENPPTGEFQALVSVKLNVPAGTPPGNYYGSVHLSVDVTSKLED